MCYTSYTCDISHIIELNYIKQKDYEIKRIEIKRKVGIMKNESLKMMKMTDYCNTCHCEGVRKHDCGNPEKIIENPTKQTGLPRSLSFARNDKKCKCAFTLAETLITLTILGVVAAITVPMLINRQMEAANRTKLKKAMAAYEKALNQMIIDNDVKTDIASALNTTGCTITSPYFKPIKTATGNNCRFQTADKVYWDISDIEHPLISLKDEITDDNITTLKGNADSLEDDKTSFVMVGEIKDGIVRINDKGATTTSPNKEYLAKDYAFLEKREMAEITNESQNISGVPLSDNDAQYVPNQYKNLPYCSETITINCVEIETNYYDDPNGIRVCVHGSVYALNSNCDHEYERYNIPAAGANIDSHMVRKTDEYGNIYTLSGSDNSNPDNANYDYCEDEKNGASDSPCKALGYEEYNPAVGYYQKI